MAQAHQLTRPMMGSATGFQRDQATRLPGEEIE
jgi:hypothetical protein